MGELSHGEDGLSGVGLPAGREGGLDPEDPPLEGHSLCGTVAGRGRFIIFTEGVCMCGRRGLRIIRGLRAALRLRDGLGEAARVLYERRSLEMARRKEFAP